MHARVRTMALLTMALLTMALLTVVLLSTYLEEEHARVRSLARQHVAGLWVAAPGTVSRAIHSK